MRSAVEVENDPDVTVVEYPLVEGLVGSDPASEAPDGAEWGKRAIENGRTRAINIRVP